MAHEPGKAGVGESVGATFRKLRLDHKGWRLHDLRDVTGISVPYLNQIERDEVAKPSREKLAKIASALGADPEEVIRRQDKAELVKEFGIEPQVAEVVLRLREANPSERKELLDQFEELLSDVPREEMCGSQRVESEVQAVMGRGSRL